MAKKKINPNQSKAGKLPLAESRWALPHVARVSEQSKAKGYEPMNWIKLETKCYYVSYLISAADRHINKFLEGDDFNQEYTLDGQEVHTEFDVLHLENAAYNLLMAAHLFRLGRTDLDDRIGNTEVRTEIDQVERKQSIKKSKSQSGIKRSFEHKYPFSYACKHSFCTCERDAND